MLVAPPAQRKREVEDKKGKARSVLEVAREIERKRREPEATRGRTMKRSQLVMVAAGSVMYARLGRKPAKRSSPIALPHALHPRYKLLLSGSCSVSRFSTVMVARMTNG